MSTRPTPGPGPLVSVVVPTYNYGRFIGQTLENLRAQTYGRWECVVVDDGSTDDTAEVVARFAESEPRVRYVRQRNQRQSVAKNTGLAATSGEYVQFLDADDLIEPLKFERQVEFMESHGEADLVYGGVRFFHTERPGERLHAMFGEDRPWMPEVSGSGRAVLLPLVRQNIMVINAPLVRRSVVDDVGPFDPVLTPVEDWDYWIRCAMAGKRFEFRDFEGTHALVRAHGVSASRQSASVLAAWRALRAKIDAASEDAEVLRLNRDMKSQLEAAVGLEDLTAGRRLDAARQFFRAGLLCPRAKGRAKFMLCGLGSPLLSARRVRALMEASL
ncbi:MAG TPA: glycosyltransferase family A protein [Pyrinomonadaceae bacterium]|nr:glycosyltransferase family A protein [Pyrinomonadaceae bacterium]